ncbi:MAG: hypothetical protein AAGC90_13000 [Curtobacterium sp.]
MSKHKRSATRKIVAASTIGALAASGAAFGVYSSAQADDRAVPGASRATVNTITGPLVFKSDSSSQYLRFDGSAKYMNGLGVKSFSTLAAAWSADLPEFTYPGLGETGPIVDSTGNCATIGNSLIGTVNVPNASWSACTGKQSQDNSQSFTSTTQGFRVNGVMYINVSGSKYQSYLYDNAGWNKPGYMWAGWRPGSGATPPETPPPSNGNASASAAASARADGNNNPAAVAAAQAAANNDATSVADAASDVSANSAARIAGNQVTTAAADAAQNVSSDPAAAGSVAAKGAGLGDNSSNTNGAGSVAANASPNSASKGAAIGTSSTNASAEANGNRNAAASASASVKSSSVATAWPDASVMEATTVTRRSAVP